MNRVSFYIVLAALAFAILHFFIGRGRPRELWLVLFATAVGIVAEQMLGAPLWMSSLWVALGLAASHSLSSLAQRPLLACASGALLGALFHGPAPRSGYVAVSIIFAIAFPLFIEAGASLSRARADVVKRRSLTLPIGIVALAVVYAVALPALIMAAVIDVFRGRKLHFMSVRIVFFVLSFAIAETVSLLWLLITTVTAGLHPERRPRRLLVSGKALQKWWTGWLLSSGRVLLELKFEVEGDECIEPAPIVVFCNHTSLVDTMLPSVFISHKHGLFLRFVMKEELQLDPALDICAARLPNYFAARGKNTEADLRGVRSLTENLSAKECVLIFPEGTRFKPSRREKALARVLERDPALYARAVALKNVMPPRPGGVLTLLESGYDVVFFVHRGLDGMAGLRELWSGRAVGKTVGIRMWRIPHARIPTDATTRMSWFYDQWSEVNDWIGDEGRR